MRLHNVVCKDKDKVFDKVLVAPLVINSSLSCHNDVTSTLHPWGNLTAFVDLHTTIYFHAATESELVNLQIAA